jgi:O-antigen ligase
MSEFAANPILGVGVGVPGDVLNYASPEQIASGYAYINNEGSLIYEPGSSYLASLAMTGLVGSVLLVFFILNPVASFMRRAQAGDRSVFSMHATIAASFALHLVSGGFALSFGNPQCLFFWLWLGLLYRMRGFSKRNVVTTACSSARSFRVKMTASWMDDGSADVERAIVWKGVGKRRTGFGTKHHAKKP